MSFGGGAEVGPQQPHCSLQGGMGGGQGDEPGGRHSPQAGLQTLHACPPLMGAVVCVWLTARQGHVIRDYAPGGLGAPGPPLPRPPLAFLMGAAVWHSRPTACLKSSRLPATLVAVASAKYLQGGIWGECRLHASLHEVINAFLDCHTKGGMQKQCGGVGREKVWPHHPITTSVPPPSPPLTPLAPQLWPAGHPPARPRLRPPPPRAAAAAAATSVPVPGTPVWARSGAAAAPAAAPPGGAPGSCRYRRRRRPRRGRHPSPSDGGGGGGGESGAVRSEVEGREGQSRWLRNLRRDRQCRSPWRRRRRQGPRVCGQPPGG